jgi:glucose-6-phosphate 1-dehydrogenase
MFHMPDDGSFIPNILSLVIQPDEGIHLRFEAKVPDSDDVMRAVDMDFHYRDSFNGTVLPDAYERLLLEALQGDASLFNRSDAIESSWKLVDPVIQGWETKNTPPLKLYKPGTWGPADAKKLLDRDGRHWRLTDPEGEGTVHAGD